MAIGLVVVLTCAGGAALLLQSREPRYGGRSLSDWVALGSDYRDPEWPENAAVQNAIREIGTNAIPFLVQWVRKEPSKWKQRIALIARSSPWKRDIYWRSEDESVLYANRATAAFKALGTNANGAIPDLWKLLNDPDLNDTRYRAASALALIGPAGITNERVYMRRAAAYGAWFLGTNALPILPDVIRGMQDPDHETKFAATVALGRLQLEPNLVLPALVSRLHEPRYGWVAAKSMVAYGSNAVPYLDKAVMESTNALVRTNVNNALHLIKEIQSKAEKGASVRFP
jgi:HEAT repeat protein